MVMSCFFGPELNSATCGYEKNTPNASKSFDFRFMQPLILKMPLEENV